MCTASTSPGMYVNHSWVTSSYFHYVVDTQYTNGINHLTKYVFYFYHGYSKKNYITMYNEYPIKKCDV